MLVQVYYTCTVVCTGTGKPQETGVSWNTILDSYRAANLLTLIAVRCCVSSHMLQVYTLHDRHVIIMTLCQHL